MKTFKCRVCGEEKTGTSPAVLLSHYDEFHPEVRAEKKAAREAARAAAESVETAGVAGVDDDSAEPCDDEPSDDDDVAEEDASESEPVTETELLANVCNWFDNAELDAGANDRVISYLRRRYAEETMAIGTLADTAGCACCKTHDDDCAPGRISD